MTEVTAAPPAKAPGQSEGWGQGQGGQRTFYHPELDVLRFAAFALVFLGHSATESPQVQLFSPGVPRILAGAVDGAGFSGLALFFTLSSYLITELLLQEQHRTGTVHLRAFYTRRVLRIWPLYFFFLLVVRPLASHVLPVERFPGSYLAAYLLLVGNWACYFQGFVPSVATPLWSISIEEQFYLFWPLLVRGMRRHIPALAVLMLITANVARVVLILYPRPDPAIWCGTLTRLDPFAMGALLAFGTHGREVRMGPVLRVLLLALAGMTLVFVGWSGAHIGVFALLFYPLEAAACSLALFATLRPMGTWTPGVVGRALVYLGRISYGLYVYHLLMLELINTLPGLTFAEREPLALACTVAASALSYALLEKPFLRLKERFTYVRSRL